MATSDYHYVLDAASLLDNCRRRLASILQYKFNEHVLELDQVLLSTEQLIHCYLLNLVEKEKDLKENNYGKKYVRGISMSDETLKSTMMETANILRELTKRKRNKKRKMSFDEFIQQQKQQNQQPIHDPSNIHHPSSATDGHPMSPSNAISRSDPNIPFHEAPIFSSSHGSGRNDLHPGNNKCNIICYDRTCDNITHANSTIAATANSLHPERSADDSLLFRLVVTLQLCMVRIEEAEKIIYGTRSNIPKERDTKENSMVKPFSDSAVSLFYNSVWGKILIFTATSTSTVFFFGRKFEDSFRHYKIKASSIIKGIGSIGTALLIRRGWMVLCMQARLAHSMLSLEDWQHQWGVVLSVGDPSLNSRFRYLFDDSVGSPDEQSKHLLQLIKFQSTKAPVWHNYGALRFGMIKWAMDTLYASVGTAIQVSKKKNLASSFLMPIYVVSAATYYALTGPSTKSQQLVENPLSSSELIQNAWGVVSLPAIKTFSLQASRLLKRAAIAEKIIICDVPCFILSKDPVPCLTAALKRFHRQQQRQVPHLHTILETSCHGSEEMKKKIFNLSDYPKKNVIFHLTGGGFFAHTIAGDVPYLMDWSGTTGAVIICPEYALLPEHTFPVAIDQVTNVYASIVSGDVANLLGFQTNKIIVSGESTGGNLAAALCVKLCIDGYVDVDEIMAKRKRERSNLLSISDIDQVDSTDTNDHIHQSSFGKESLPEDERSSNYEVKLPDALMLCCPALDLSLNISPSRLMGTRDPVLPGGLISAISDAYIPSYLGENIKQDPLASPYFAPDHILKLFPPTLLYASSEDPLLDDSVSFNKRLRALGVDSDLRAALNMPHAYFGLGTAGFPEARKAQKECQAWMVTQFHSSNMSVSKGKRHNTNNV